MSSSSATSLACQRSTSRRISTARWRGGRCWSAATNARRIVSRATTSAGSTSGHHRVRDRLHPGALGRVQDRGRLAARPEVHRACAALAAAQHVEADIRRDAVQPRAQRRAPLEAVVAAPGADHRLLHGVLGLEGRAEHAVGVGDELRAMLREPVSSSETGVVAIATSYGPDPVTWRGSAMSFPRQRRLDRRQVPDRREVMGKIVVTEFIYARRCDRGSGRIARASARRLGLRVRPR